MPFDMHHPASSCQPDWAPIASSAGCSAYSTLAKDNEDWTKIRNSDERRRVQNRIAQRLYRRKLRNRIRYLENQLSEHYALPVYHYNNCSKKVPTSEHSYFGVLSLKPQPSACSTLTSSPSLQVISDTDNFVYSAPPKSSVPNTRSPSTFYQQSPSARDRNSYFAGEVGLASQGFVPALPLAPFQAHDSGYDVRHPVLGRTPSQGSFASDFSSSSILDLPPGLLAPQPISWPRQQLATLLASEGSPEYSIEQAPYISDYDQNDTQAFFDPQLETTIQDRTCWA